MKTLIVLLCVSSPLFSASYDSESWSPIQVKKYSYGDSTQDRQADAQEYRNQLEERRQYLEEQRARREEQEEQLKNLREYREQQQQRGIE